MIQVGLKRANHHYHHPQTDFTNQCVVTHCLCLLSSQSCSCVFKQSPYQQYNILQLLPIFANKIYYIIYFYVQTAGSDFLYYEVILLRFQSPSGYGAVTVSEKFPGLPYKT